MPEGSQTLLFQAKGFAAELRKGRSTGRNGSRPLGHRGWGPTQLFVRNNYKYNLSASSRTAVRFAAPCNHGLNYALAAARRSYVALRHGPTGG